VIYDTLGGNPGGYICQATTVDYNWYFKAPAKFLGDKSGSYNKALSFDIMVTDTTTHYTDIWLIGDGNHLISFFLVIPSLVHGTFYGDIK